MPIPAPDLPNVWLARIEGDLNGEPCANVLAFVDTLESQTAAQVADGIMTALDVTLSTPEGAAYQNVISTQRTWSNVHVVRYDETDPDVADESLVGADFQGNDGGEMLPYQVALCISLRTGVASRRARGRLYDYGFTISSNDTDGLVVATTRDTVVAFWEEFRLEVAATENLVWSVLSRGWIHVEGEDDRDTYPQQARTITNLSIRDNKWDTIRSRVPR